jgi:hypothetical protein
MLTINYFPGVHVRVVNRQPTQQLGPNGRDDGPVVSFFLRNESSFFVVACYYGFSFWLYKVLGKSFFVTFLLLFIRYFFILYFLFDLNILHVCR